jgi:acyl-CoA synthetase (AMP-forming)/AMP-acid ligase II
MIQTLVELSRLRAQAYPDRTAYVFLHDGEIAATSITYADLDARARAVAARLREVARPGDRVVLVYPPGLEYIEAFFGCLYAGIIAVPAHPPSPSRPERALRHLRAILEDAGTDVVAGTALVTAGLAVLGKQLGLPPLRLVDTGAIAPGSAAAFEAEPIGGDTVAFLQYTSGSTATPRGVTVRHANLLHNQRMICEAFGHTSESKIVSWLPLYHDMGLIGAVLQPLYLATPCVLMSPLHFLQRPMRWLEAISRHGATTSGGPNFAYDLCVRRSTPEERAALDLSSWQVAYSGAEPVRAATLDASRAASPGTGRARSIARRQRWSSTGPRTRPTGPRARW